MFRNIGIHFNHLPNITNSTAAQDYKYDRRLARLKGETLQFSPEVKENSGLGQNMTQALLSHNIRLDNPHYETSIMLSMSAAADDPTIIPQEQAGADSSIVNKLSGPRYVTTQYDINRLPDTETLVNAYDGSLATQSGSENWWSSQYLEQQQLLPMDASISKRPVPVSEPRAAQKARGQHTEWAPALDTFPGTSQPDLVVRAVGHETTKDFTNRQTIRPQCQDGGIAEHGPAERMPAQKVDPLREANGNGLCDGNRSIHIRSYDAALSRHVDGWYPDGELVDMQHDYQHQPYYEQTTDLLDEHVSEYASLFLACDYAAQAPAAKYNVDNDDMEHQDMIEFWRPNYFRAL